MWQTRLLPTLALIVALIAVVSPIAAQQAPEPDKSASLAGQFLVATSDALRGLAARLGVDARDLPTLLGHPQVTPVKLVDEYLWIRVTRGR